MVALPRASSCIPGCLAARRQTIDNPDNRPDNPSDNVAVARLPHLTH